MNGALILAIAKSIGVNAYLLVSICTVESNLNNVNNFKDKNGGSFGTCQLNLKTARQIAPNIDILALQQPMVNAHIAALYLKRLEKKYKTNRRIASAYNAGRPVTYNPTYVNKVMRIYEKYKKD